jgi:hypothetical protein
MVYIAIQNIHETASAIGTNGLLSVLEGLSFTHITNERLAYRL